MGQLLRDCGLKASWLSQSVRYYFSLHAVARLAGRLGAGRTMIAQ